MIEGAGCGKPETHKFTSSEEKTMFSAILIDKGEGGQTVSRRSVAEDDLPDGDVSVDVAYSTLNFKDGLAITGSSPVVRKYPMIPGIDLAGVVSESRHPGWSAGDAVILNGWGIGEVHWGGLAQKARVKGDWLVPLPAAFTLAQAMAIGTAGYTAALCVNALVDAGIVPEAGDILVTGATGGVGSVAIPLLKKAGFRVAALTGKTIERPYLDDLGADSVIDRTAMEQPGKPLQEERWAGVIDAAGSNILVNACAQTRYGGAVAACGLAQGMDFPATVLPFILRGVRLLGIDSVMAPRQPRLDAWERLARDLDPNLLDRIAREIPMSEVVDTAARFMSGEIKGRYIVDVNR